jgi:hypothetical protein
MRAAIKQWADVTGDEDINPDAEFLDFWEYAESTE